jgi:hypothetical protein
MIAMDASVMGVFPDNMNAKRIGIGELKVVKVLVSHLNCATPSQCFSARLTTPETSASCVRLAPFDKEMIEANLLSSPDLQVIVLTKPPIEVAEAEFAAGAMLEACLSAWAAETQRALALFRRHRRRVTLVNLDGIQSAADWFVDQLSVWPGDGAPPEVAATALPERDPSARAALIRVVAQLIIMSSVELRKIAQEYSASLLSIDARDRADATPVEAERELRRLADIEKAHKTMTEALAQCSSEHTAQQEAMRTLQAGLLECQRTTEIYITENERLRSGILSKTLARARALARRG